MIGIICAMAQELDKVLELMTNKSEEEFTSFNFVIGNLNNHKCVAVLSGIGKVNAAICTQTLIIKYQPDIILNIGVAGGIDDNINIGDIVVAESVVQHDFDISAFVNRKKGEIPGIDKIKITCIPCIVQKILTTSRNIKGVKIHKGIIASGDQFINCSNKLLQLKNEFDAVACEMEAGSIGQVCYVNKVNFGVIRSISDNANSDAKIDFYEFIENASKNAARILYNFTQSI